MNYRKKETTIVVSQEMISEGIYDLRVKTPAAEVCVPGQFVGIFPPSDAHILMRPISICDADADGQILRMVYRIAGEGMPDYRDCVSAKHETIRNRIPEALLYQGA